MVENTQHIIREIILILDEVINNQIEDTNNKRVLKDLHHNKASNKIIKTMDKTIINMINMNNNRMNFSIQWT